MSLLPCYRWCLPICSPLGRIVSVYVCAVCIGWWDFSTRKLHLLAQRVNLYQNVLAIVRLEIQAKVVKLDCITNGQTLAHWLAYAFNVARGSGHNHPSHSILNLERLVEVESSWVVLSLSNPVPLILFFSYSVMFLARTVYQKWQEIVKKSESTLQRSIVCYVCALVQLYNCAIVYGGLFCVDLLARASSAFGPIGEYVDVLSVLPPPPPLPNPKA